MKKIAKILAFCIIFVLLFNYIYRVLSWKDTAGQYYSSMDSFYELEDNVVDVLFLGSSHCYCSINNASLWDDYGMSTFSLAISGQDLAGTYYCMKEALKTQKPKVIMVEVFGALIDGYEVQGNLYRNTLPFKPSLNAYEAINSMVEEDKWSYLLKWPIIHTRYAELQKEDFQKDLPVYLGYHAEYQTQYVEEMIPYMGTESVPIGEEQEQWLVKIADLAKESGTDLCFFVAPYAASEAHQMRYKYVEELAERNGVAYLNLIAAKEELALDQSRDFIDWMHTNYFGAEKVTAYVGEYLQNHYSLEDHTGDKRYALWEKDSKVRQHEVMNHTLQSTTGITEYLELIGSIEDYNVMIATGGNYLLEGTMLELWLSDLGIAEEFFETGGFWVIETGQVIYRSTEQDFIYRNNVEDSSIKVSSGGGYRSIVVDGTEYGKVADGINIVVYDKVLGKVADAVGFSTEQQYGCVR